MATVTIGVLQGFLELDDRFTPVLAAAETKLTSAGKSIESFGRNTTQLGRDLLPMGLAIGAVGAGAIKLAVDFESSFAGIIKTTDGVADKFGNLTAFGEQLKQGMRDLSKEIPINVNELNKIGEAAGQLGIKKEHILGFTEVMAKLGVTTNLSSEEAADSMARLANITQMPQENFDRLGSTIVALGNNSAATEAEIAEFGLRIAGAGEIAGLTEANILSIGTAMASVGVEAEAGGTAIQKVLISMTEATATGNENLAKFAQTAGMSKEAFATLFKTDAAAAFTAFVEGLGRAGTGAFQVLDELDLKDQRLIRSFISLAGAGKLLSDTITIGNTAWAQNSALGAEAEARFRTVESQMTLLWNRFKDIGVTLGEAMMPSIKVFMGLMEGMLPVLQAAVNAFTMLPAPVQAVVVAFGALVTALPFLLMAFGSMSTGFGALITTLGKLAPWIFTTSKHFEGLAAAAGLTKNALGQWVNAGGQVVTVTSKWSTLFTSLTTGLRSFGTLIMGVVANFTSWGGVMTMAARVLTALRVGLTAFAGPIGIAVTAVTLLVPLLWKAIGGWEGFKAIVATVGDFIADLGVIIYDLGSRALGGLMSVLSTVGGFLRDVFLAAWNGIVNALKGYVLPLFDALKAALSSLTDFLAPFINKIKEYWNAFVNGAKEAFGWVGKTADEIRKKNAEAAAASGAGPKRTGDIALPSSVFGPPAALATTTAPSAVATSLAAELSKTKAAVAALTAEQRANIQAGFQLGMSVDEVAKKLGIASPVVDMYKDSLGRGKKSADEFAAAQKKILEAEQESALGVTPALAQAAFEKDMAAIKKDQDLKQTEIEDALAFQMAMNQVAEQDKLWRIQQEEEYWKMRREMANQEGLRLMEEDAKRMQTYGSLIKSSFKGSMAELPQIIVGAFQGGGNVLQAIGSKLGGDLGSTLSTKLGEALKGKLGGSLGGAIGSMIPGLGAMLGPLIGNLAGKLGAKIWGGIKSAFGGGEEGTMVNPARDKYFRKFQDKFGGSQYDAIVKAFQSTDITGDVAERLISQLYAADTMKEFDVATAAIDKALEDAASRTEKGLETATSAAEGFDFAVTGSDEAIKALGETQDRVVNAMLQGFDALMVKLDELIMKFSAAGGIMGGIKFPGVPTSAPQIVPPDAPLDAVFDQPAGYDWAATTPAGEGMPAADMTSVASLTVNTTVESQIAVGTQEEFQDAVTQGTLAGIEQGGAAWTAFRALATQAVAPSMSEQMA